MLTVLTQNSRFRRSAGCISREWRQKGEFSPSAEWLPESGSALRPKFSVGSQPMRTFADRTRPFGEPVWRFRNSMIPEARPRLSAARRACGAIADVPGLKTLKLFLIEQLESNYALHEEPFKSYLTQILQDNLPPEQADTAEMLAAECAPHTDEANEKLEKVLGSIGLDMNTVLDEARADKAKELVQQFVRGEREAVTLVNELLTEAGPTCTALAVSSSGIPATLPLAGPARSSAGGFG
jgi:hypothetical protein